MLTVYCDLHEVYIMTPPLCILNSRTSLLRAIGSPTDSLHLALRYRSASVTWYPTRCSAANRKNPEQGIKIGPKPEFDV